MHIGSVLKKCMTSYTYLFRRHAKMTSEFKTYFEDFKNPSMVAAATSHAMVSYISSTHGCISLTIPVLAYYINHLDSQSCQRGERGVSYFS